MFDFIKRHKKDDDFGDIRSNVMSEQFNEPDFPPRQSDFPPRQREPDFPPRNRAPSGFEDPLESQQFGRQPRFQEPQGFNTIDMRSEQHGPRGDYDVSDRLNLIESQLSAIRSMTETINERLKNMESRMGYSRRY